MKNGPNSTQMGGASEVSEDVYISASALHRRLRLIEARLQDSITELGMQAPLKLEFAHDQTHSLIKDIEDIATLIQVTGLPCQP